jgi:hypothetical protein
MSFRLLVKLWIWASVLASAGGWLLSALGCLNRTGYTLFAIVGVALLWWTRRAWDPDGAHASQRASPSTGPAAHPSPAHFRRRRFRLALPLGFAVLAVLIFLGGALYPPTNHTAITYRIPRVLQWLSAEQWHWIHTPSYRMNDRACGIEWLSAPILLFTRSDRALFLLNFIPFLLMPGLIFSVFARLGVRARVAWAWMWLLPTGYCFVLQAGTTANDTFPAFYALAAMDFALRAWTSRRASDLWFSLLAAALLTGAKASNLPLLLGWGLLLLPLGSVVKPRLAGTVLVAALAALVSFIPTALLNLHYCGDWSGLSLERPGMDMKNPIVGIWGNVLIFIVDNFVPPFFPLAGWWNQHALEVLPRMLIQPMVANFEAGFHTLWELPSEDWVGLGFGVSVLAAVSVIGTAFAPRSRRRVVGALCSNQILAPTDVGGYGGRAIQPIRKLRYGRALLWAVWLAPWIALLVYCVKSGMVTGARLIAPYYPLLLPTLLLHPVQEIIVRRRWWKSLAVANVVIAVGVLMVTPGRPLWPAQTILARLAEMHPDQRLIVRARNVYSVYGTRSDPLASVRALLPPGLTNVGFRADGDDPDISLWRPFGTRTVSHIMLKESPEEIRRRGIRYAVVGGFNLISSGTTLSNWMQQTDAELVASTNAIIKVSEGVQPWYLVRFR